MPSETIGRVVLEYPISGPGHAGFVVDTLRGPGGLVLTVTAVYDPRKRIIGPLEDDQALATLPLGTARVLATALLLAVYRQAPPSWGWASQRDALWTLAHLSEMLFHSSGQREAFTDPVANFHYILRRFTLAVKTLFASRREIIKLRTERDLLIGSQEVDMGDLARLRERVEHQRKEIGDKIGRIEKQRTAIRELSLIRQYASRLVANANDAAAIEQLKGLIPAAEWTAKYQ